MLKDVVKCSVLLPPLPFSLGAAAPGTFRESRSVNLESCTGDIMMHVDTR